MSTCGYICPQCEGAGFTDDGNACDWCTPSVSKVENISDEEWLKQTHESCGCSDD
jgi:hypothetical protein